MSIKKALIAAGIVVAAASGCNQSQKPQIADVDQVNLCEVSAWQHDAAAKVCKPGQKVVFLPETFGNAQLPILFAAVNCDLRYAVALTHGAVTCIYNPITPKKAPPVEGSVKK